MTKEKTTEKTAARLFLEAELQNSAVLPLEPPQAHFLKTVLRLEVGRRLLVFNGRDGEWLAKIIELDRKRGKLQLLRQTRMQEPEPELWLAFAPIKAGRIDWLVEKATELGASRLLPVLTERTIVERVKLERLQTHAREAAEQCERLTLPEIEPPRSLDDLLRRWPAGRRLLLAAERSEAPPLPQVLQQGKPPLGLLVGPEGGFTEAELKRLAAHDDVQAVALGPRILRSETAALAGLAVLQALSGDWSKEPAIIQQQGH